MSDFQILEPPAKRGGILGMTLEKSNIRAHCFSSLVAHREHFIPSNLKNK
jgi:hypothetical protein